MLQMWLKPAPTKAQWSKSGPNQWNYVFIEQAVPARTRVVNGQGEHARMDLVFNLNGSATYLDVSIFLLLPATRLLLLQQAPAQDTWPRELRRTNSTDIHTSTLSLSTLKPPDALDNMPRIFISSLMKDADNPHSPSGTPGQVSRAYSTAPSPHNNLQLPLRDFDIHCLDFRAVLRQSSYVGLL